MNTAIETKPRKPHVKAPTVLIVEREFIGNRPLIEAMLPVIIEDLRRKAEQNRSFDIPPNTT